MTPIERIEKFLEEVNKQIQIKETGGTDFEFSDYSRIAMPKMVKIIESHKNIMKLDLFGYGKIMIEQAARILEDDK